MALGPCANTISVREVIAKLDTDFSAMTKAVQEGEFALWVGSGISRKAPNLGDLIESAFEFVRERATETATSAEYLPALEEMLNLAELDIVDFNSQIDLPFNTWPENNIIIDKLWNNYSRVLDVRIPGEPADFILWNAIDIRSAFSNPPPPAAEHLCIAVLVLEGAIKDIASANWDGFIEDAVKKLSGDVPGILQVVVDPDQLRSPPGRARLLKFHGCIDHATQEPAVFRSRLIGSRTQVMGWPEAASLRAMCNELVGLATTRKTLVMGLSIQDNNLQTLFARAKDAYAWPWPCDPAAPAYSFCEDSIRQGQRDVLRLAYGESYDDDPIAIQNATLLRAWGEKVLIALALDLITAKFVKFMVIDLTNAGKRAIATELADSLKALRNNIAELAVPQSGSLELTEFVTNAIMYWSRLITIFRNGSMPESSEIYETLTSVTPNFIVADQNAQAMNLGRLGLTLSLLNAGKQAGNWSLKAPARNQLQDGALTVRATHHHGVDRPLFIVKSVSEAISLTTKGAFAAPGAIVIHADDTWEHMIGGSSRTGYSARRVKSAPGRTGHVHETHISLGSLLERSSDKQVLERDFLRKMML